MKKKKDDNEMWFVRGEIRPAVNISYPMMETIYGLTSVYFSSGNDNEKFNKWMKRDGLQFEILNLLRSIDRCESDLFNTNIFQFSMRREIKNTILELQKELKEKENELKNLK